LSSSFEFEFNSLNWKGIYTQNCSILQFTGEEKAGCWFPLCLKIYDQAKSKSTKMNAQLWLAMLVGKNKLAALGLPA
jgi:hypothetical protein